MDLDEPAVLVCVGRASGDVAVVSEVGDGRSTLSLYSINGDRVARRPVEPRVTALATSSAPEGSAVNVVATGHVRTGQSFLKFKKKERGLTCVRSQESFACGAPGT